MQILQIHVHVLLVTLWIRVTFILLPSWIKKKKIDPFKNSQGWIYNFFFYSKFQKMIYITLFFKKCILISLSTYKPINTKKYLTMIYDKFWIIAEVMGTTWTKHYCWYKKEGKVFHMMPYNQVTGKLVRTCFALLFYLWSK